MAHLLHDLVREAAEADPGQEAARQRGQAVTYGELDRLAGSVAGALIECGVAPGDRVAIQVTRGIPALACLYGAMRAGAVFVPIDTLAPPQRVAAVLRDCEPSAFIGTGAAAARILAAGEAPLPKVAVALDGARVSGLPIPALAYAEAIARDPHPGVRRIDVDLAQIVYTSGSTGTPKGVALSHRSILTFMHAAQARSRTGAEDRIAHTTPLHFSMAMLDLFHSPLARATLVVIDEGETLLAASLVEVIRREGITLWRSVPSALSLLLQAPPELRRLERIRQIWFAGEALNAQDIRRLQEIAPNATLWNMLGGSETLGRMCHRIDGPPPDGERIPVGTPLDGTDAIVLGDDAKPIGPGGQGELYMRGSMLMSGYWRDPERTDRTLVPNPLSRDVVERVCRTGDVLRLREDGLYEFVGRVDDQVKSRGVRIELADIERALEKHPDVVQSVAVAIPHSAWGTAIVAGVVTREGSRLDAEGLRAHAARVLPLAMLPSRLEFLSKLPLNSTGKVDRAGLRERWASHAADLPSGPRRR